jgi:hypothetical protein
VTRRSADPFGALGLRADVDVTDDEVRAAWRRVAAATHPDRGDGGDPERFALAAAAYTELRTAFGRGEARAELSSGAVARIRIGRPVLLLLLRLAVAVGAGTAGVLATGPSSPAGPALAVGALTWLLLTARGNLMKR